MRLLASIAALAALTVPGLALAQDPCVVEDDGTGTVELPPPGCHYLSPMEVHMIIDGLPPGTTIELSPIHRSFFCLNSGCGVPGGNLDGEVEDFDSEIFLTFTGTGELEGFRRQLTLPLAVQTHTGPRGSGSVQTFDTEMFRLQGAFFGDPDFDFLQITVGPDFGLPPSPGSTTLTQLPSGDFQVDSFFDIVYRIDFQGAPGGALDGLSGSTQAGPIRMEAFDDGELFTDGFESGDTAAWTLSRP